jgi:ribonuclease Z
MDVTLLGTGNPLPDLNRGGPATLVRAGASTILIDAGRGVMQRVMGAGVFPPLLTTVFITHLHSDHISDLNDVITTHWVMNPQPAELIIYGPPRMKEIVNAILAMLVPDIEYRLAHHEDLNWEPQLKVIEVEPGDTFMVGDASVRVAASDHKPVHPSVAFRIDHDGTSVVIGGDGIPCAGLDELCAGATAYVQTVIREDLVKLIPNQRFKDILDYHSSVEQAAETAARGGVKKLILTHYVPAMQPGQEDEWRARAAAHFSGEIFLGDDLLNVTI